MSMVSPDQPPIMAANDSDHEVAEVAIESVEMFDDVVSFVIHHRPDVREAAIQGLVDYCEDRDMISYATGKQCLDTDTPTVRKARVSRLVSVLLNTIGDKSETGKDISPSQLALSLLVNFSGSSFFNKCLVEKNASIRILENLWAQDKGDAPRHRTLNFQFLLNLAHTRDGCRDILSIGDKALEGYNFLKLMNGLYTQGDELSEDDLSIIMKLLHSLSYYDFARSYVLDNPSMNLIYKKGLTSHDIKIALPALTALKHLCWTESNHKAILEFTPREDSKHSDGRDAVWDYLAFLILTPIGSERDAVLAEDRIRNPMEAEFPRVFEPIVTEVNNTSYNTNTEVREQVYHVIVGLLRTPIGRESARAAGVYTVIRLADQVEEDEEIKKIINDHIHLIVYTEAELEEQDQKLLREMPAVEAPHTAKTMDELD